MMAVLIHTMIDPEVTTTTALYVSDYIGLSTHEELPSVAGEFNGNALTVLFVERDRAVQTGTEYNGCWGS